LVNKKLVTNLFGAVADLDQHCWGSQNNTSKIYTFNYWH